MLAGLQQCQTVVVGSQSILLTGVIQPFQGGNRITAIQSRQVRQPFPEVCFLCGGSK